MYTWIKTTTPASFKIELPSISFSLIIAENFYRFGSFTVEAIAFLGTWYLSSFLLNKISVSD
jgi:hypothetical protein